MKHVKLSIAACAALVTGCTIFAAGQHLFGQSEGTPVGMFQGQTGVGTLLRAGAAEYDPKSQTYTLTGSGENMWSTKDDFEFVWRQVSAENVSLAANISILGSGGDNHRKAVLMIRQSLDDDSAYADVARHGDGLTSLQFRDEKGAATHEIESNVSGPQRLRIDKRGDRFYMWIGNGPGQDVQFAGGSVRVALKAPFYVGIGVCAHNKDAVQQAAFTNVGMTTTEHRPRQTQDVYSTLETIAVASTDARVAYVTQEHLENASWNSDGTSLIFRAGNRTQQVSAKGGTPEPSTGRTDEDRQISDDAERASPDGKQIAFLSASEGVKGEVLLSVTSVADHKTRVLAKLEGGPGSLSAHPWSPDGKRLTFISYQSMN